ncbi:TIGR00730 family Rossman fold protein [Stenoxybacter acetivorans]|uniref:LOG family protein n=1 Tax=Stenoxybacter acetivorans TaxID=422441 RepID=UPI001FE03B9B|nr:TIGR00730 family Rossman fold protein [Stenoxybacter acetivorans]
MMILVADAMNKMNNIVVYCGSNLGQNKAYFLAAQTLGHTLAQNGQTLIYGGGHSGLMGAIADAALSAGGRVIGVIPTFLKKLEKAHTGLSELIETDDMAARKNKMIALADAFIALPGGLGTYEELFEVLSQAQLKLHNCPIGLLNIDGFFDPIVTMLQHTIDAGFMPQANMSLLSVSEQVDDLLTQMARRQTQDAVKWIVPQWLKQENKS